MAIYSYSLEDFSNGVNIQCLHNEIEELNFPQKINGITFHNNLVNIDINGSLNSSNETILNTLISEHNPVNCPEIIDDIIDDTTAEIPIQYFQTQVKKSSNNMSTSTWFDSNESSNSTGSWSGYAVNNLSPIIIPYNCKLIKALISLRGASFNWLGSSSKIHLTLAFFKMNYNGTEVINSFKVELDGFYTGNSFDWQTHNSVINSFEMNSGENLFNEGDVIGVMFRNDTNIEGSIYNLKYPYIKLIFEEVR